LSPDGPSLNGDLVSLSHLCSIILIQESGFYKRDRSRLSLETRYDQRTSEYVAVGLSHRRARRETERSPQSRLFRVLASRLEERLANGPGAADGPAQHPSRWVARQATPDVRLAVGSDRVGCTRGAVCGLQSRWGCAANRSCRLPTGRQNSDSVNKNVRATAAEEGRNRGSVVLLCWRSGTSQAAGIYGWGAAPKRLVLSRRTAAECRDRPGRAISRGQGPPLFPFELSDPDGRPGGAARNLESVSLRIARIELRRGELRARDHATAATPS